MVQAEYANEASYTKRALPPSHRYWFRHAYNKRAAGTAKATIDTFIATKIPAAEVVFIMDDIAA